jgi:pimeloyl-ACP methyl ester carboxylesterase
MPSLTVNNRRLFYDTAGDGFPLILLPDTHVARRDWAPAMPLLGELCRVIAYEYERWPLPGASAACPQPSLYVADLAALLDALDVERAYLAGYTGGGQIAVHFALHHPGRLEGLVLISPDKPPPTLEQDAAEGEPWRLTNASLATAVQNLHVPVLRVAGAQAPGHMQLGHVMVEFLLQCERQRTLVRGASFLL